VELIFKDATGTELGRKSYTIRSAALPSGTYPAISIDTKNAGMAPGMTLVSYFGYRDTATPQTPFIFDNYGDIRWYFDFHSSPVLNKLFYDDGMERLQNGNLYFGDGTTNTIYELDFLGRTVNTYPLTGYSFHHNVQEKPNGNFLVTVNKLGKSTSEDEVVEIDRATKQIIRVWDLKQSLQYSRQTLTTDPVDWIHLNAVIYDESDNSIIVSGRTQGLIKLDESNHVVWILGPHTGWGIAGNGADLNNFLLQPLDNAGQPITTPAVVNGSSNHPDFEWNWYQHAPLLMPNHHVMMFDNGGGNRNFSGSGSYSRAVEYDINASAKTVKQVWQYGKERGAATYSSIVSDVDYIPSLNHVIFSPGAVNNGTIYGKVIETDYTTKNILFEATITPPHSFFGITMHRTERMNLYQ